MALTIVLGAPGSGKSTIAPLLRELLSGHGHLVIDWDQFMPEAAGLAGRDVPTSPDLWDPYRHLLRAVVRATLPTVDVVVLGVSTPDELVDWPPASWVLLDCADAERRARLAAGRRPPTQADDAVGDAAEYRRLGFRSVDSSGRTPHAVAAELAVLIGEAGAG